MRRFFGVSARVKQNKSVGDDTFQTVSFEYLNARSLVRRPGKAPTALHKFGFSSCPIVKKVDILYLAFSSAAEKSAQACFDSTSAITTNHHAELIISTYCHNAGGN